MIAWRSHKNFVLLSVAKYPQIQGKSLEFKSFWAFICRASDLLVALCVWLDGLALFCLYLAILVLAFCKCA